MNQVKVPAILATGIICFVLGVGLGGLTVYFFPDEWFERRPAGSAAAEPDTPDGPKDIMMGKGMAEGMMGKGMMGKGMMGKGMMGKGMMGKGMMGKGMMGKGMMGMDQSAKSQLASLVVKLDQLTRKPLDFKLNEEQRAKLREQLQGLNDKKVLDEEDAKKRLEAALKIVEADKETLEAAGYRWPGQGGDFKMAPPTPNPFMEEDNGKHLKSLQQHLANSGKS